MTTKTDVVLPILQTEAVKSLVSTSNVLAGLSDTSLATLLVKVLPYGLPVNAPKELWVASILGCLEALLAQWDGSFEAKYEAAQKQMQARGTAYQSKEAAGEPISEALMMANAPSLEVQFAEFRTAVWQELSTIHEWLFWLSKAILAPEDEPEESTARAHDPEG